MKKCSVCLEEKPTEEFYPKVQTIRGKIYSGLQSRCKSCNKDVCRTYAALMRKKLSRAS